MAVLRFSLLAASFSILIACTSFGQERQKQTAQDRQNPLSNAISGSNGVVDTPNLPLLQDYRKQLDPKRQREAKEILDELPVFGYSYFHAARQMIEARRAYFGKLIQGAPTATSEKVATREGKAPRLESQPLENGKKPGGGGPYIPTQEELDAIDKLTSAQKLDLLLRAREHRLTDTERRMYRSFLFPAGDSTQDPTDRLSDQQKVDLLIRQRDNKLTDAEKQLYSTFLYPERRNVPPEEALAIQSLTDVQKIDLLKRLRQNQLTDEEKRKYRTFLYPTESERSTPNGPDESGSLSDAQKLDLLMKQQRGTLTDAEKSRYRSFLFPNGIVQKPIDQFAKPVEDQGVRSDQQTDQQLGALNAFANVAGPLAQQYQNITATAPTNYQLGFGDSIVIRVWSPTMELKEFQVKVDEQGYANLTSVGRFLVRGMTTAQAENAMRAQVRRVYRDADLSITASALRTMSVTLSGEVYEGGTYQVPAVATAINMIYSAGGPTDDGTLRRIEVRRRGKLVGTVDFYKFLITGDVSGDIDLQPGDVIFVPGRQNRIAIRGEVLHPAQYELLPTESLKDALRYAGGVKASGVDQRVQITTVQPGSARILKDVDARNEQVASATKIYEGDTVEVFSLRSTVMNKVTIEGAVDQPAEYAFTDRMTIADLVLHARGLTEDAYTGRADIFRYNPDNTLTRLQVNLEKAIAHDPTENIALFRWDLVRVYTRQEISWTGRREVTVRGAVRKPGIYYRSDNMKVKDLLLDSGGTIPEAYMERAALLHQRPDGTYAYDYISLASAVKDDPKHNVPVLDRDILAVYRVDEAAFTPEHTVTISGEVVTPSTYPRGEGMKLSDLLQLAGGITPRAADRITIAHSRINEKAEPATATISGLGALPVPDVELADGDIVTIQGRGDFYDKPFVVAVKGSVFRPGPVVLRGRATRLTDVIKEAGGLKPEAFPQGVEFTRQQDLLAASGQRSVISVVNQLNELLNQSAYRRELAKSDIERIRAYGGAVRSGVPLAAASGALSGILGSATPENVPAPSPSTSGLFTRDLVAPPRQLTAKELEPSGNVAVNLALAMEKPGTEDDLLMMDGDQIVVPERPTTVQVIGAVYHPRGVLYRAGEKLDYYIDRVGGFTPDASRERVLVIRAGGGLIPLNKAKTFDPGDVILVPTRVLAERISNRSSEIDNIFRNITSTSLIVLLGAKLLGL